MILISADIPKDSAIVSRSTVKWIAIFDGIRLTINLNKRTMIIIIRQIVIVNACIARSIIHQDNRQWN